MADAFISYSRTDIEFAKRLSVALERRGKDVWVDFDDIAPGSPWANDLRDGIASADAFAFVISPESAASIECRRELEYAEHLGKRIIPINLGRVDPAALPSAVVEPNWVPQLGAFETSFEASVDSLIEAMDTDHEWVRAHTEYGQQARRWDDRDRGASFLLTGSALDQAEAWLDGQKGKDPPPTPLHTEFIRESRRRGVARLRRTRAIVTAGLLVAAGLAIVAAIQWRQAVLQKHTAQSQKLAADATVNLEVDPELSVLLTLDALGVKRTGEAESVLRRALPAMYNQLTLAPGTQVRSATYSPDGSLIATAQGDGSVLISDARSGHQVQTIETGAEVAYAANFDPDGERLVTAGEDGMARIWDARSGESAGSFDAGAPVYWAEFSPDGERVATAGANGDAQVWDAGGPLLATMHGHSNSIFRASFDPSGRRMVTASYDGTARIWDARSGRSLLRIEGPQRVVDGAGFSPDGKTVFTVGLDGSARLWSATTGKQLEILRGHNGLVYSGDFSADGGLLVTSGEDGTARIWISRTAGSWSSCAATMGPFARLCSVPGTARS